MPLENFIGHMPKVELHVHLEGSIGPETLLELTRRNQVKLPVQSIEEMQAWIQFTDFNHFIDVYIDICSCLRTVEDFELITTEFLRGQAQQNILYSEVIFTPFTHHENVTMDDQLAAINRARYWAKRELGVRMRMAPDISRMVRPIEHSLMVADWAIANRDNGIIALGLGGPEIDNPPLFSTTLTDEYRAIAATFGFNRAQIQQLVLNAVRASLLLEEERFSMEQEFERQFSALKEHNKHSLLNIS